METIAHPATIAALAAAAPVAIEALPTTIEPSGDYKADVAKFIALLQERQDKVLTKEALKEQIMGRGDGTVAPWRKVTLEAEFNRKYVRIWRVTSQRCAYCFLDQEGNIFKADGYKKPAQGVRGNIYNPAGAILGTELYGAVYFR